MIPSIYKYLKNTDSTTHKELGVLIKDSISGQQGMLTHFMVDIDRNRTYIFQPKRLNPTTGQPVDRIFITDSRIVGGKNVVTYLPLEVLGESAEDTATGFKGKIVSVTLHINGCIHVEIKPNGYSKSTGATIDAAEFDIRRIKCRKLQLLTKKQIEKSKTEAPSPEPVLRKQPNKYH